MDRGGVSSYISSSQIHCTQHLCQWQDTSVQKCQRSNVVMRGRLKLFQYSTVHQKTFRLSEFISIVVYYVCNNKTVLYMMKIKTKNTTIDKSYQIFLLLIHLPHINSLFSSSPLSGSPGSFRSSGSGWSAWYRRSARTAWWERFPWSSRTFCK